MDLADSLSEYAVSLRYSDLSEHAVHTAKQRLVDTLGCGLGAFDAVPVRNGQAFARVYPAAASIPGIPATTSPPAWRSPSPRGQSLRGCLAAWREVIDVGCPLVALQAGAQAVSKS